MIRTNNYIDNIRTEDRPWFLSRYFWVPPKNTRFCTIKRHHSFVWFSVSAVFQEFCTVDCDFIHASIYWPSLNNCCIDSTEKFLLNIYFCFKLLSNNSVVNVTYHLIVSHFLQITLVCLDKIFFWELQRFGNFIRMICCIEYKNA